ncbi:MAG: phytase [Lysobacter sp.]
MTCRLLAIACTSLLLSACVTSLPRESHAPSAAAAAPASHAIELHTIAERYVSEPYPEAELDSLATWPAPDGSTWLIASAKSTHSLMVFDADSGALIRTIGGKGTGGGQFNRPNGVAVHGDRLFVVERDGHRLQMLDLPGLQTVASFGADVLRSPYGLWINETAPDELEIYVTDNFMYGERHQNVPPLSELDQRVRRFRVQTDAVGELQIDYLGSFGETKEPGALQVVESIAGDPSHNRLLIANEYVADNASTLREYTLDGRYTGRSLPRDTFATEAEGVALWSCRDGAGYWVAVDQRNPLTVFHLFERRNLAPAGSFQGQTTGQTDGIALHAASTASFPDGALFAVHHDKAVAAFDLAHIARALGLAEACTSAP